MSREQYGRSEPAEGSLNYLSPHRRKLMRQLAARDGSCGLATVAREIAAETGGQRTTTARTRRLYASLHDEVEEMAEAGLVDYCDEVGVVELTARGRAVLSREQCLSVR